MVNKRKLFYLWSLEAGFFPNGIHKLLRYGRKENVYPKIFDFSILIRSDYKDKNVHIYAVRWEKMTDREREKKYIVKITVF